MGLGRTSNDHPTSSIQDRIRLWQEQGGGVVELKPSTGDLKRPSSQTESSSPDKLHSLLEKAPDPVPAQGFTSHTPDARQEKRSRQEIIRADERPRSAPTKRVISDGHWRKRDKQVGSPLQAKNSDPDFTVQGDQRHGLPTTGIIDFKARSSSLERRERRKRRTQSARGGIRQADSSKANDEDVQSLVSHLQQDSEKENFSNAGSVVKTLPNDSRSSRRRKRLSWGNEHQGSSPPHMESQAKDPKSLRPQKGSMLRRVLSDSRRALAKQNPEPMMTPRIPSIQAWLEYTPDPFTGEDDAPLNDMEGLPLGKSPTLETQGKTVEDPNHIWDTISSSERTNQHVVPRRRKTRRSARKYNSEEAAAIGTGGLDPAITSERNGQDHQSPNIAVTAEHPAASPALKRRQARKSTSSPVGRSNRASPLTQDIDRSEVDVVQDSQKPEFSAGFASPIIRRKRKVDQRPSSQNEVDTRTSSTKDKLATTEIREAFPEARIPFTPEESQNGAGLSKSHPNVDGDVKASSLRRRTSRLTTHSDLISVLSMPRHQSKSSRSGRTLRDGNAAPGPPSTQDIMLGLEKEEVKYARELRTLVEGVVPVLLTCILSKAESAVAAGLFQSSGTTTSSPNVTRPIVDMAIALERLKSLHRRIPSNNSSLLLSWAHGAKRVYAEYLKAWRLGFQDVIVNLAPAVDSSSEPGSKDAEELPRDATGNVIHTDGEKVDVAFLLKRPLVRLKRLARTLNDINAASPSREAAQLALEYDSLVEKARLRVEEERARLEDEAAANIDATRSRDPRSMAPLKGVLIDGSRRVRARDYFSCTLEHSTGQSLDCQVELILREEAAEVSSGGGDLLVCEIDGSGRWLLFPPISLSLISARTDETTNEMVLMIRGSDGTKDQWQEMLLLTHFEDSTIADWRSMLASEPLPPAPVRTPTFRTNGHDNTPQSKGRERSGKSHENSDFQEAARPPSLGEIQVPIGEQAVAMSSQWRPDSITDGATAGRQVAGGNSKEDNTTVEAPYAGRGSNAEINDLKLLPSQRLTATSPAISDVPSKELMDRPGLAGNSSMSSLKRHNAKRQSRHENGSVDSFGPSTPTRDASPRDSSPKTLQHVSIHTAEYEADNRHRNCHTEPKPRSEKLPLGANENLESVEFRRPDTAEDHNERGNAAQPAAVAQEPVSRKVQIRSRAGSNLSSPTRKPLPPSHLRSLSSSPVATQAFSAAKASNAWDLPMPRASDAGVCRSSSPLKQVYDYSVRSEASPPESDLEDLVSICDDVSSMTESSEDEDVEAKDVAMPLVPPILARRTLAELPKVPSHSTPEGSIKPSDSASQAPYKTVPEQRQEAVKTVATLYAWSEKGSWEPLHPDECSIVVSPGLIEAFEMSAAHSNRVPQPDARDAKNEIVTSDELSQTTGQNDEVQGERPLVALELTPLVPLRRGTAIDISIRSPPTSNSWIKTSNNLMFRSRSAEECEALYAMINFARIHNPTYIALQNARGPFFSGATYADAVGRRPGSQSTSSRSSWFGGLGRSASYRAKSKRTPSISPSQSSVGTMSSAFSALRRFGRGNGGRFNIALSTVSSRQGAGGSDPGTYSLSDNSSAKDIVTPMANGMVANNDGSLGLKDAKIRLYVRANASRWRDLGSARLTILQPDDASGGLRGDGQIVHEKRILIQGKTKGEVLLDIQLGESSFERVARTGIGVHICEDVVGPNGELGRAGAIGGVAAVRTKIYMIQLKSEAEAAYTFSLVGKLRY